MAAQIVSKKKCEYWDKCYRKNKKHREEFLHPEADEKTETKAEAKPNRLTHDISVDENEAMPSWRAGAKRKQNDNDEGATPSPAGVKSKQNDDISEASPSPKKVVKFDDSDEEKITVDYSKAKTKGTNKAAAGGNDVTGDAKKDDDSAASSSKTIAAPEVIKYKAKKEKCKYGDKCYQTGAAHRAEFAHSGDDGPDEESIENKKTRGQTKESVNPLEDGGVVEFDSGYKLKRDGEVYSCSCKGFLVQRAPLNERTCKHLKEYLGGDFEKKRVEQNTKPKKTHISSHINVSVLLAHKYEDKTNPVGWWISEKLDGVRAFWNGRCFYSRLGNAFYAPEWFTKDLPTDMTLDGELFGGRGQFQSTVSIVKTAESPKWKDIKYHVFDSPDMGKETFENRMNAIKEYFEEKQPEYAVFVEQVKCKSKDQLEGKLTRVLNLGGEGLMIRQPKSVYERTRSKTLLKIKKFYDAEAIVIGHEKGKGVNQHRCGALRCRMACGKEFSVGSGLTDKDRNRPPKIGTIITYKFQELSKSGSPRFPTYVGIRIDMTEPKDAEIRPVLDEDEA
ncbi:uncharacterized protein LOC101848532 [Aplysia californica]|uniref:Uncharacterized protein LOC101848532 n=1 Tax=Aplysia californica TaxID=6500 RepID=A0ABM0JT17_APLCA|nr:uncharacterized protein LOC101848532 [Aplysia californica]